MQVNEVVVNGVTELSLVNDTVSEDTLLENVTAHDASGNQIVGKVVVTPVDSELNDESENAIQNKAVAEALKNVDADTLDGLHATSFFQEIGTIASGSIKDYALSLVGSGAVFANSAVTDMPFDSSYWFVIINKCNTNQVLMEATNIGSNKKYICSYNAGTTPPRWYDWSFVGDRGNAATVNGLTVQTAVPANAKFTDTTYGVATTSANGLMSAADKIKLDGLGNGTTIYTGTYIGSGIAMTITIGVKPKVVIVQKVLDGVSETYFAVTDASSSNASSTEFIKISNTGFTVDKGISTTGVSYLYMALA